MDPVLALDLGGSKLAAALVDADGALLRRAVRPTPHTDAEAAWVAVAGLVDEVLDRPVRGVGIAAAGPVDLVAGTVSPINLTVWQRFGVVERIGALVPGVPVRLGGDGTCMAMGEQWLGAAAGARFVLGAVVSTGVGGGLVLDGRPYHGRTGNAGHVGHIVVDPAGAVCSCGGRGCVETVAAGPRMTAWARAQGWTGADAAELAADAAAGDPVAVAAFRRAARAVAAMIASVAAVCDLDLAVVGGGVAAAGPVLFEPLTAALADYAGLDFLRGLRVVPAALGADAGLIGAAALLR
ncbi:ROK family protein [uncultured Mycolicibacterium sp.]|uniref:ROK family protein n=1 Tax=uncultured Mycolicibacterium sp. TaxID=2320817 RepID=UPI002632EEE5|nr:ROK family protein [uncultured Mycolicibacterium sp.]